ncbi:RHS repeat domain-containing protein [Bacillus cereus]|uniref:RHS repeat domain-containing protein n=1 Tax=Bacillus cereus TaxID=1396 RepID=UPI0001A061ED|nr:Cell wall-associated protein [Bacillus cereus m1550]
MSNEITKTNSILQLLHGDVVAMTDQNREVVATYEYDSWGNVLKSDAKGIAADNPFGYEGYMYDKEIGMYYLIARYYNPEHGVFLSVDPDPGDEDDPVTMNGYTYGDNNPVMKVDPDGHYAIALAAAGTNFWNPVGWVIAGGLAIYGGYQVYKFAKSNYNPDPYARPGQKKQGRENKEKKGWKSQSNKRDGPSKPKKHTPGKGHGKY